MDRLWLNGQLAQMGDETPAINVQVWDVHQFESVHTDFSFGFKLPRSERNEQIINNAGINSTTTTPYVKLPAVFESGGVVMVRPGGYAIIEQSENGQEYNCTLYGEGGTFYQLVKDKKITELTTLPHFTWNMQYIEVNGYWRHFPLIDWHAETPTSYINDIPGFAYRCGSVDFMKMYPGETLKNIISAIFTENGYAIHDVNSVAWSDPIFEKIFIPCENQLAGTLAATQMATGKAQRIEPNMALWQHVETILSTNTIYLIQEPTVINLNYAGQMFTTAANGETDVMFYRVRGKGKYSFHATCDFAYDSGVTNHTLAAAFYNHATGQWYGGQEYQIGLNGGHIYVDISVDDIEITDAASISVVLYDASWEPGRVMLSGNWLLEVTGADPLNTDYEYDFEIGRNLPDITMLDLIRDWLKKTLAMMWVDEEAKKVYVYQWKELYTNQIAAESWDAYMDHNAAPEIKYRIPEFGRVNYFEYEFQSGDYGITGANWHFFIQDEGLQVDATPYKSPFNASIEVIHFPVDSIPGGLPMAKIRMYNAGVPSDAGPRFLLLEDVNLTLPVMFYDQNTPSTLYVVLKDPITVGRFTGVRWQDFINEYFEEFEDRTMVRAKVIRQAFVLPPSVIRAHKANIPIYSERYGAYFYVNKIENYVPGESSIVELIKL